MLSMLCIGNSSVVKIYIIRPKPGPVAKNATPIGVAFFLPAGNRTRVDFIYGRRLYKSVDGQISYIYVSHHELSPQTIAKCPTCMGIAGYAQLAIDHNNYASNTQCRGGCRDFFTRFVRQSWRSRELPRGVLGHAPPEKVLEA